MKQILVNAKDCGKVLDLSEKQILHLVRKKGLPCVYISRRTIRFDVDAVKKWSQIQPILSKTGKMRVAEKKRRATITAKRQAEQQPTLV